MLDEVDGPMNFTQMVTLFASKMAGGSDDDDVILASFEAFEIDGKIDADAFRHSLMTLLLGSTPLLCGDSHSFCEKSSSPSSIRDSPLGLMKIYCISTANLETKNPKSNNT